MSTIPEPIAVDARAKIIWGENPQKVLAFLQSKNVSEVEAGDLIEEVMRERDTSIRSDGAKKIWLGVLFAASPLAYYLLREFVGFWSLKLFAGLIFLGIVGLVKIAGGLSMVLKPRSFKSDLADTTG